MGVKMAYNEARYAQQQMKLHRARCDRMRGVHVPWPTADGLEATSMGVLCTECGIPFEQPMHCYKADENYCDSCKIHQNIKRSNKASNNRRKSERT